MLSVINIEESIKWDNIVKSFKDYDVYYLSEYVKAFRIHGDGEPLLFYYDDLDTRGINVVMKRDISRDEHFRGILEENKYFDFATPYGYGGWLIEGENKENLFNEYNNWCKNNNIISEFVRFHPVLNNYEYSQENYEIIKLGSTVTIDIRNKAEIWSNFDKKNRNVIRKALNSGIEIRKGFSKELFAKFIEIYNETMDKDNADQYYYFKEDFYESILNDLSSNAIIFYAILNDKIIAMSIMIYANKRFNYHLSGSVREYQHFAPSNLLLWEAAEYANELCCTTFHLGGGVGSQEDSLFRFKRAFYKGDLSSYFIGKKVFDAKKYDYITKLRKNIKKRNFFPEYRG